MSKDKLTGERIYNLEVRFISKDGSKWFKHPHRLKLYENDFFRADIVMPDVWFNNKDLDTYVATLEKALELACDYLVSCGDDELFNLVKDIYDDNEYLRVKIKYFKDQAQKELKNERKI